jgi:putative addiction module CopG family antidote
VSNAAKSIQLPEDLQAFAEERVRAGQYASVVDVVRDALERQKLAILRDALDAGIADLEAGDFVEGSPEDLVKGIRAKRPFDDMP